MNLPSAMQTANLALRLTDVPILSTNYRLPTAMKNVWPAAPQDVISTYDIVLCGGAHDKLIHSTSKHSNHRLANIAILIATLISQVDPSLMPSKIAAICPGSDISYTTASPSLTAKAEQLDLLPVSVQVPMTDCVLARPDSTVMVAARRSIIHC